MNFDFIRRRITELRLSRKMSEYQLSLQLGQTVNHLRALDDNELEAILKIVQQIEDLKEENRKLREGADGPRK